MSDPKYNKILQKLTFLAFYGLSSLTPSKFDILYRIGRAVTDKSILPFAFENSVSLDGVEMLCLDLLVFSEFTLEEFML